MLVNVKINDKPSQIKTFEESLLYPHFTTSILTQYKPELSSQGIYTNCGFILPLWVITDQVYLEEAKPNLTYFNLKNRGCADTVAQVENYVYPLIDHKRQFYVGCTEVFKSRQPTENGYKLDNYIGVNTDIPTMLRLSDMDTVIDFQIYEVVSQIERDIVII